MTELFKTITDARAQLSQLARDCQHGKTYVFTHNGLPQAVLVGFEDYRSMKTELRHAESIKRSLEDIEQKRTVTLADARTKAIAAVREKAAKRKSALTNSTS